MVQEAGSIGLPQTEEERFATAPAPKPRPAPLLELILSVVLIGLGALVFACLLGASAVLYLYLRGGADGVVEFYQELRFDFRLKTLMSAIVISALYVAVAVATIVAALLRGRGNWPGRVAWSPVQGGRLPIVAIFGVTLLYAAAASLTMALMRSTRVVVAGSTDLALVGAISANLIVLAPLAEELFFRGWLYTGLRARLSFWPSFIATVALFAAIHWDASHRRILLVFPLAVALGVLREVTGSIKPTIALHATYNLIIILITLLEI